MTIRAIPLAKIRRDGGTQIRAAMSEEHIDDLVDSVRADADIEPVVVFLDGETYWLADGFHRFEAHARVGVPNIRAKIEKGELRDAILYAVGANARNSLKRSPEDKRRAVLTLLSDKKWSKWSDREIARRAGVGNQLVGQLRASYLCDHTDTRIVERNGSVFEQKVGDRKRAAEAVTNEEFDMSQPLERDVVDARGEPEHADTRDHRSTHEYGELDEGVAASRIIALCDAVQRDVAGALLRPLHSFQSPTFRDGIKGALLRAAKFLAEKSEDPKPTFGLIKGGR